MPNFIPFFPYGLRANDKKITEVADGTDPTDAVNLSQLTAAAGGFIGKTKSVGDSPVAAAAGDFLFCDASGGDMVVNLPSPAANVFKSIQVKKIDTSDNLVTVSGTLPDDPDGGSAWILSQFGEMYGFFSDGTAWRVY
jgi:hypothetical protein